MKSGLRRDKAVYQESEPERALEAGLMADMMTLLEITRRLSEMFQSTCKPVRNKAGMLLRTVEKNK